MLSWFRRSTLATLSPQEAFEKSRQGEICLVDVREAAEWAEQRISGAIHLPISEMPARLKTLPKDKPVVFYCRTGMRSGQAVKLCRQAELPHHTHMAGGITAWRLHRLPIQS